MLRKREAVDTGEFSLVHEEGETWMEIGQLQGENIDR
jgi:hypothetical protein